MDAFEIYVDGDQGWAFSARNGAQANGYKSEAEARAAAERYVSYNRGRTVAERDALKRAAGLDVKPRVGQAAAPMAPSQDPGIAKQIADAVAAATAAMESRIAALVSGGAPKPKRARKPKGE